MKKQKKAMKKVLSVILALAMVITSISYMPKVVSAEELMLQSGNKSYMIDKSNVTIDTLVLMKTPEGFNFAWNEGMIGTQIKIELQTEDATQAITTIGNGGNLTASDLDVLNLTDGSYALVLTSVQKSEYTQTLPLTVTVEEDDSWTSAQTGVWSENSAWQVYAGSETDVTYKNQDKQNDFWIKTEKTVATGDIWAIQAKTTVQGLTPQKEYKFTITLSADKDGVSVSAHESNESQLSETTLQKDVAGQVTGTFTTKDAQTSAEFYMALNKESNAGATFHITNVSVEPVEEEPTIEWLTDQNLTAGLGVGAKYRTEGNLYLDAKIQFGAEGISVTTGSQGSAIEIYFNDGLKYQRRDSTAVGAAESTVKYSEFQSGLNVYKVKETFYYNERDGLIVGTKVDDGTETPARTDTYEYTVYIQTPNNVSNFLINDYSKYTGKYIVKFDDIDGASGYKVYVDGKPTEISIQGSGDYFTCKELTDAGIQAGTHQITITAMVDGTETAQSLEVSVDLPEIAGSNNDIAQIYIQTDDTSLTPKAGAGGEGKKLLEKDGVNGGKKTASLTVVDQEGSFPDVFEDTAKTTVKVRGNSTAGAEKKAYNISFSKAKNLLGLSNYEGNDNAEGAKKWSLLANAFDKTLIRNKLALDLGYDAGLTYNSKNRFVDLYFNGVYLGNYLLVESVEAGESRVDIDSENTETYNTDALVELEVIHGIDNELYFWTGENGGFWTKATGKQDENKQGNSPLNQSLRFIFGSPETEDDINVVDESGAVTNKVGDQTFAEKKVTDIKALFDQFETDLAAGDYDKYSQYIDVDSFVADYLMNELFQTKDIAQSSTRFYVKNKKIYAGPMWDHDLSSGNVEGAKATDMTAQELTWFKALMQNDNFKNKVVAKYREMHDKITQIYAEGGTIDTLRTEIEASATRNYLSEDAGGAGWTFQGRQSGDGWSNSNVWADMDTAIGAFKTYMQERVAFLDKEWHIDDELSAKIDSTVTNLAKGKTAIPNVRIGEGSITNINDGKINLDTSVVSTDQGSTPAGYGALCASAVNNGEGKPASITIDLGDYYKVSSLDNIFIQYRNAQNNTSVSGKSYQIQYSTDDITYHEIVNRKITVEPGNELKAESLKWNDEADGWISATDDGKYDGVRYTMDSANQTAETEAVRYVRVYYPAVAGYGMQITEIAVLADNPQTVTPTSVPAPTLTDVKSDTDRTITGKVVPATDAVEGTTYVIYLNGERRDDVEVDADGNFKIEGLFIGEYQVCAAADYQEYLSEKTESVSVTVNATTDLFPEEMLQQEGKYNLAYEKSYWISRLEDGKLVDKDGAQNGSSAEGTGSITDGKLGTTAGDFATPEINFEGTYFTIDLGKQYPAAQIDSVSVWFRSDNDGCGPQNAGAEAQLVQYSTDNKKFTTVATVSQEEFNSQKNGNAAPFAISVESNQKERENQLLNPSAVSTVRYVRILWPQKVAYGAQVTEVAVFDENLDAKPITEIDPMTPEQIAADSNLTEGVNWGDPIDATSNLYVYDPDGVRETGTVEGTTGILRCGLSGKSSEQDKNIEPPLASVVINGVDITSVGGEVAGDGLQFSLHGESLSKNGIYKVEITDHNGTKAIFYYKKDVPPEYDYTITGVTVTEITDEQAVIQWVPSEDLKQLSGCNYKVKIDDTEVGSVTGAGTFTWTPEGGIEENIEHRVVIEAYDQEGKLLATSDTVSFKYLPEGVLDDDKWILWDNGTGSGNNGSGHDTDVYGNVWYYYNGYGMELSPDGSTFVNPELSKRVDGYAGLRNDGGRGTFPGDVPCLEICFKHSGWDNNNTRIDIDGTQYTLDGTNAGYDNDRILIAQSLFQLSDQEISKVFHVTITYQVGQEEKVCEMYYKVVKQLDIPPVEGLNAYLAQTENTVVLNWKPAEDEKEAGYEYEIYVDGIQQKNLTVREYAAQQRLLVTLRNLPEGTHRLAVIRTREGQKSATAATYVTVYDESKLVWTQWTSGRTQDIDNDTWWYAKGYMNGNEIFEDANFGPRITDNGLYFRVIIAENGTGAHLNPATQVTINGVTYPVAEGAAGNTDEQVYHAGDQIYLSHELFPVDVNVRERIFAITVSGTMNGSQVLKTFLVKLNNEDYKTADLEYVADKTADGKPDKDGHVVLTWTDPKQIANDGYKLHYYDYRDDYNPNAPETNKERVVWIKEGDDYEIDGDGNISYHLTENGIYLRSNTEIWVVPVIDSDGAEYGEEVGIAVGQAELTFYGLPTTKTGAYVSDSKPSTLVFSVINIGTAAVATKALATNNDLLISVTEYTDADRKTSVSTHDINYNLTNEHNVLPGQVIEATHDHVFKDRKVCYFTAVIDPKHTIYELDQDTNNTQDYDIAAAYEGSLKIEWDSEHNIYTAIFSPAGGIWNSDTDIGQLQGQVKYFEFEYSDHGELKKCRIANSELSRLEGYDKPTYKVTLPHEDEKDKVNHIDSDSAVTIAVVYVDNEEKETVVVFADDTPFWQETEMDWTPITDGSGSKPWDFPIANQKVHIEYKVLDSSVTDVHYRDIITGANGYGAGDLYISTKYNQKCAKLFDKKDMPYDGAKSGEAGSEDETDGESEAVGENESEGESKAGGEDETDGEGETGGKDNTVSCFKAPLMFGQVSKEYCENYVAGSNQELPKTVTARPLNGNGYSLVYDENYDENGKETVFPGGTSNWGYGANETQIFAQAWGLGKYYIVELNNKEDHIFVRVAYRVCTDESEWYRVAGPTENEMKFYYHDTNHVLNSTFFFDASDFYLSHASNYDAGYMTVTIDSSKPLNSAGKNTDGKDYWKIEIARSSLGEDKKVIEPQDPDAYATFNGGPSGQDVGHAGDNDIQLRMYSLMKDEKLIAHSGESGSQNFYYMMRIYYDTQNNAQDYIKLPLMVQVDIPEIVNVKRVGVVPGADKLYVNLEESETGKKDGYVYDIYYLGDGEGHYANEETPVLENVTEGGRYEIPLTQAEINAERIQKIGEKFKVKVVSKWCFNKDTADSDHYYDGALHYQSIAKEMIYENETPKTDINVQGFQMNTNKEEGGVSEFMPSMRVVSRTSTRMVGTDSKIHAVVQYGTILALSSNDSEITKDTMTKKSAATNDKVLDVESTGTIDWAEENSEDYYYYAVSLKKLVYQYAELETKYCYRAYAVLDNEEVVYGDRIYEVNVYEIAENLYKNRQMRTKEGHDFLYNDVLNIVNIYKNAYSIGESLIWTTYVSSTDDPLYKTIQSVYEDLIYYATTSRGYSYQNREQFASRSITEEQAEELLAALKKETAYTYPEQKIDTLYDWIDTYVGTRVDEYLDLSGYKGFYQKVDYNWGNSIKPASQSS